MFDMELLKCIVVLETTSSTKALKIHDSHILYSSAQEHADSHWHLQIFAPRDIRYTQWRKWPSQTNAFLLNLMFVPYIKKTLVIMRRIIRSQPRQMLPKNCLLTFVIPVRGAPSGKLRNIRKNNTDI